MIEREREGGREVRGITKTRPLSGRKFRSGTGLKDIENTGHQGKQRTKRQEVEVWVIKGDFSKRNPP